MRLAMDVSEWIRYCEAPPFLRFVPVNNRIALPSVRLPGPLHPNPADRIITATVLTLGATLVSKDERIISYPHVDSLW